MVGQDYVQHVTHKDRFAWDEDDGQSAAFRLKVGAEEGDVRQFRKPLPAADIPIVAYDFGMKYNIARRLRQHGFKIDVVPATTSADDVLKAKPAGPFSEYESGGIM